jgi:hypothetical protein
VKQTVHRRNLRQYIRLYSFFCFSFSFSSHYGRGSGDFTGFNWRGSYLEQYLLMPLYLASIILQTSNLKQLRSCATPRRGLRLVTMSKELQPFIKILKGLCKATCNAFRSVRRSNGGFPARSAP